MFRFHASVFVSILAYPLSSADASLEARLILASNARITEGDTVSFRSSVTATIGHIVGGSVTYLPGEPATLVSGPDGYDLFHGSRRTESPVTTWRYLDDGQFTHSLSGGGAEHNSSHANVWSGSFDGQPSAQSTVVVRNARPRILNTRLSPMTIDEGSTVNASMAATDPGMDSIQFLIQGIDTGTGGETPGSTRTSSTVQLGPFTDSGLHGITFSATDDDDARDVRTLILRVINVAPTIDSITQDLTIGLNEEFNFFASASDPGADTLTFAWDLNEDGVYDDFLGPSGIHAFQSTGVKEIQLLVDDGDGGTAPGLFIVTVVPEPAGPALQAGDADQDLDFDQLDLVKVQIGGKYLSGQATTWGEGDWNGAPGGNPANPPAGDGLFNQLDVVAAQQAGIYLTGPYAAIQPNGQRADAQTSIVYNTTTGELAIDAPAGMELTSINIDSAAGIFTGNAAQKLGGSFDNDADHNIFKATFGSSFGSLSYGNVAMTGLAEDFVLSDLTVVGSLAGGGELGEVDLIYVPEPSSGLLSVIALMAVARMWRRQPGSCFLTVAPGKE